MGIAAWIQEALSRADSWCAELERLRAELATELPGPDTAERRIDLAEATEHVDPDRSLALKLYLQAWRDGDLGARTRVLELARELRAYVTVAEVAISDHQDTQDPEALVTAGRAFLDAGLLERAAETFKRASTQHASLADAIGTSARLADVRTSLGYASSYDIDAEREIDSCMARAQTAGEGAPALFLQAARIARIAGLERYGLILGLAARSCPRDEDIARLFEDVLLERGNADDLLAHHRRRFDAMKGEAAWVDCVRASASELVLRNIHPGLGLRMLRTSIEHAYAAKLPVMPRHIAAWELLLAHARTSQSTVALAPLVADGFRGALPDDDKHYLARVGLEIAWRDVGDVVAAQPYAAALLDREPGHPLATAFLAETFAELPGAVGGFEESDTIATPAVEPEAPPVLPTITFRIPVLKDAAPPAAPTPVAASVPDPAVDVSRTETAPIPGMAEAVSASRTETVPMGQGATIATSRTGTVPMAQHALARGDAATAPAASASTAAVSTAGAGGASSASPPVSARGSVAAGGKHAKMRPERVSAAHAREVISIPVASSSPAARPATERKRPAVRVASTPTTPPWLKRDVSPIPAPPAPPPNAALRAPRKVVPVDVVVELPSGSFFTAMLRDLSTSGAFVTTKRPLDIGTLVTLEIRIPTRGDIAEQRYRNDARIARRTDLGCGLAFVDPPADLVTAIAALIGA